MRAVVTMDFDVLIAGAAHDPHSQLGAHPGKNATVIRTLRRGAHDVTAVIGDERTPLKRVNDDGIFEASIPGAVLDYRLEVDGELVDDPYRFTPDDRRARPAPDR